MAAHSLMATTLGGYIEEYLIPQHISVPSSDLGPYARSLRNLYLMLKSVENVSTPQEENFLQALTPREKHLQELLREWWTTPRRDNLLESTVKPLVIYAAILEGHGTTLAEAGRWAHTLGDLAPASDKALLFTAEHTLSYNTTPPDTESASFTREIDLLKNAHYLLIIDDSLPDVEDRVAYEVERASIYHRKMLSVFSLLCRVSYDREDLSWSANILSPLAAAERIGHSCWRKWTDSPEATHGETEGLAETLPFKDMRCDLACIPDPCFWLQDEATDPTGGMPHYLWDIEQERTVETQSLDPLKISYAIVSYSWGRWRKAGNGTTMSGVPWWRIPENTRFDVTSLPGVFKRFGLKESYIWFDIFCIPQDVSTDERLARICQVELARQASIFRRAGTALAWFNDISDWTDLRLNLEYNALVFLRDSVSYEYSSKRFEELERAISAVVGQTESQSSTSGLAITSQDGTIAPAGWLTSLWTLQETLIRPDMVFLNNNWEPLLLGAERVPISLASMVSLTQRSGELDHAYLRGRFPPTRYRNESNLGYDKEVGDPNSVHALRLLIRQTGFVNFTDLSPISPIVLGRTRVCTNSRAEAIMAVCGATAWHLGRTVSQFQQDHESSGSKEELLCGLYPLEFIQELYTKTGSDFFLHAHTIATLRFEKTPVGGNEMHPIILRGSMLPFTTTGPSESGADNGFSSHAPTSSHMTPHSALQNWLIQKDGSVIMLKAGVVASNLPSAATPQIPYKLPDGAKFTVFGNSPDDIFTRLADLADSTELVSWLRRYNGEVYAICCKWSPNKLFGVIIQHVEQMEASTFVKVATFASDANDYEDREFEFPGSWDVEWQVL